MSEITTHGWGAHLSTWDGEGKTGDISRYLRENLDQWYSGRQFRDIFDLVSTSAWIHEIEKLAPLYGYRLEKERRREILWPWLEHKCWIRADSSFNYDLKGGKLGKIIMFYRLVKEGRFASLWKRQGGSDGNDDGGKVK